MKKVKGGISTKESAMGSLKVPVVAPPAKP
jgi:hypothetical protein